MALLEGELNRIKYELGYSVLTDNAVPYVDIVAVFETVVQNWTHAGETTTSSTAVVAATTTPTVLTLADATGFETHVRAVVDVGPRQEVATVQSVSGSTITLLLSNAHSGTYPVTVEGGESIVREILARIEETKNPRAGLLNNVVNGQVAKVDEVSFFKSSTEVGRSAKELDRQLAYWRNELSSVLGVPNVRDEGASATLSVY